MEELLEHVARQAPVDDPRVRELAARWDALADPFHADGPDRERTRAAAQRAWEEHGEDIGRTLPWPTERIRDLVRHLERVRGAR